MLMAAREALTRRKDPGTLPLQVSRISKSIFTLSSSFNYLSATYYLTLPNLLNVLSSPFRASVLPTSLSDPNALPPCVRILLSRSRVKILRMLGKGMTSSSDLLAYEGCICFHELSSTFDPKEADHSSVSSLSADCLANELKLCLSSISVVLSLFQLRAE